ncbi:discoidin domain-containing protein [Virgibacillus sp. NKC19-3]|nr:discoidin domain-containing protein [Virgibacillus sp. NKC19-3]
MSIFVIGYLLLVIIPTVTLGGSSVNAAEEEEGTIGTIEDITVDNEEVYIDLSTGEGIKVTFLKDNLFRFHLDPDKEFPDYPEPNSPDHETKIIDKNESEYSDEYGSIKVDIDEDSELFKISTEAVELRIEKETSKMSLYDKNQSKVLWEEAAPLKYESNNTVQTLSTSENEYFYGGGQQNGYYSHKNETINISVGGGWDAGAASSPVPFYLSTDGYGVMRNTFQPGTYDFSKTATFEHSEERYDAYYFVEDSIPNIIDEYTELTGEPALLPEYAFYVGHLDCFNGEHNGHGDNRSLMEDGLNTLNSYMENDMPLGWFTPNDGYGCGYDGLDNLEEFTTAANEQNVKTGLWTESELEPDPDLPEDDPLRRDLDGEIQAGVRAIKTDVAWVGPGYSMALDATRLAAEGISKEENSGGARPFIVSLNGWAGTQRYASLWSGDQYGGNWEYIRMHIPTYIGAGLSGNPNVGSDMDGIFGGDEVIQTRDFQWKTFTPTQLDMDGWASSGDDYTHEKTPWNYGEPYASINRLYLKLKSQMLPYNYTIAEESTSESMPMVRGMMLEYPDDPYTYGTETQYQYMWGPNLLVAPVYKESDHEAGVRDEIYLPDEDQVWIDYFTGEQYEGGSVIHNFEAPLWKTPVFVKNGAIIPMAPENNSPDELDGTENRIFDIYPEGESEFTMYEDDGESVDYKDNKNMRTKITSIVEEDTAVITVDKAKGNGYDGIIKDRGTEFIVNTQQEPEDLTVHIGDEEIDLTEVKTEEEYEESSNVFFYNEEPNLNKYSTEGSEFEDNEIITTPKLYVKIEKTDITANDISLTVDGFNNTPKEEVIDDEVPETPTNLRANEEEVTADEIKLEWDQVEDENVQYEVMIDGVIHSNVFTKNDEDPYFTHSDLNYDTDYTYKVRAVNTKGPSEWSEELKVRTELDPFRNVPENMTATASSYQSGEEAENAIDGDENTQWHTEWGEANLPYTYEIDMQLAYDLDKFEYLPRIDAGNGTILNYDLDVSLDGKTYKNIVKDGSFEANNQLKTIDFDETVHARFIKLTITDSVGDFGSAREFRPYKKNKTEGWVVGKNISDGAEGEIGEDDLNFFASYMGVDKTDSSWNQVMKGDINYNGVIDAYDLMYVASHLGEEPLEETGESIEGSLDVRPSKLQLEKGEEFTVDIIGNNLQDINAFNLELTFDPSKYKLADDGINPTDATKHMLNYSKQNGQRMMVALSNKGSQPTLEGNETIATVKLEAREDTEFDASITRSLLLNTSFDTVDEIGDILEPKDDEISAAQIKSLVEELNEEGEFEDNSTVRSLTMHLEAVSHYEGNEEAKKVVKHMNSFKQLLNHQRKNQLISEQGFSMLKEKSDSLLEKWQ